MVTPMKIFSMIITFTVLLSSCSATVYKVGDSHGWTVKEDLYKDWIKGKEFHVGDSLIFEYNHHLNDVTQLSDALGHGFCDSSSPEAVYNTGHDVVTFTEPGYYYFITSNQTRCESGQRLDVAVYDPSRLIPPLPPASSTDNVGGFKRRMFPEEEDFPSERDFYEKIKEEKRLLRRQRALRIKAERQAIIYGQSHKRLSDPNN